jgi:hypothetical protein
MALIDLFKRKKDVEEAYESRVKGLAESQEGGDELSRFRHEVQEARQGPEGRLPPIEQLPEEEIGEPIMRRERRSAEPEVKEMEEFVIPPRTPPPILPPTEGRSSSEGPPWERPTTPPAEGQHAERPPHIHLESDRLDLIMSKLDVIENRLKLIEEKLKRF